MSAVFHHDSHFSTRGVGARTNNPGNMRVPSTWKPSVPFTVYHAKGNGTFSRFESLEHGIIANVELYQRFYSSFDSAAALTRTWAKTNNPAYHAAIRKCFE
jgi:hypothetical protein